MSIAGRVHLEKVVQFYTKNLIVPVYKNPWAADTDINFSRDTFLPCIQFTVQ